MEGQVTITLDPEELMRIERILIDRDQDEALRFVRECIKKKVEDARRTHCKPPF